MTTTPTSRSSRPPSRPCATTWTPRSPSPLSDRDRACALPDPRPSTTTATSASPSKTSCRCCPRARGRDRRPRIALPDPEPRPGRDRRRRRQPMPRPATARLPPADDPRPWPGHRCRSPGTPGRPDFLKLKRPCAATTTTPCEPALILPQPRPGAQFALRHPLRGARRGRAQGPQQLGRQPQPRRDAARLRINNLYAQILRDNRGASGWLSSHLQEARWLIKNVQQRLDTIQRVSQAIVDRQRQFFDYGDVAMRPLTLREIAEQLDLHESTVSRVTTQSTWPHRAAFLNSSIFSAVTSPPTPVGRLLDSDSGADSPVRGGGRQKPLSDAKIADLLGQQGIVVASPDDRKVPRVLDIPPVSLQNHLTER